MQDNGSWGGPSHSLDGRGPVNADWVMVLGGDGFVCRVDPVDPDFVYAESQEGNMTRFNLKTGRASRHQAQPLQRVSSHTASTGTRRSFFPATTRGSSTAPATTFSAPINAATTHAPISPEITPTSQGSATALAESPQKSRYPVGGHRRRQSLGHARWRREVEQRAVEGRRCPSTYWVSTIEPSHFIEGRCYVCFDAHRSDDDEPYVYVTEDFGETWKSIARQLAERVRSRCLREDLYNRDVLYLGSEFAVWASIDRGVSWTKINNNLPTVAIHELAQHPTAGEMVAATHGRSLWILDVTPLRQLKPDMTKAVATLLVPNTAVHWRQEASRFTVYGTGSREYFGENPLPGAHVYYALTQKAKTLQLTVHDYTGKPIVTLAAPNEPGLHRVTWNLRGSVTGMGVEMLLPARGRGGFGRGAQVAPPGQYRVVLTVDGKEMAQGLRVENDPTLPDRPILAEDQPTLQKRRQLKDQ